MITIFKTELHCHSAEVSACARICADEIIDKYIKSNYSAVVLTNHFAIFTYEHLKCSSWQEFIDKYLYGYSLLKDVANGRLEILFGIELRPKNNPNDYLMYGVDERFLRENEFLFDRSVEELSKLARENGILFVQAHPFRDNMQVTNPDLIDGIEVYNGSRGGHYKTDSRNEIARAYGDKYKFIETSGTDLHYPDDKISGGIITVEKIQSTDTLVKVLKSGNYELITCDDSAS